jgi:hypothetical protein
MQKWLEISKRSVLLENGRSLSVAPFRIAREPVSFDQFQAFCKSTKYETSAQRLKCPETYLDNSVLRKIGRKLTPRQREMMEVMCVSFDDASQYCKWAGVRLPTEEEWLAASVFDWKNRFEDAIEAINQYASHPQALRKVGAEWTNASGSRADLERDRELEPIFDTDSDKQWRHARWAIVRRGPQYVLHTEWDKYPAVYLAPCDYSHPLIIFRVCTNAVGSAKAHSRRGGR